VSPSLDGGVGGIDKRILTEGTKFLLASKLRDKPTSVSVRPAALQLGKRGGSNPTLLFLPLEEREWDLAHRVKLTSREANRLGSDRQEKGGCEPSCLDLSVGRAGAGQSLARRQRVRGRGRRRERVRRGDVLFVFAQGFGHGHHDEARHDKDRRAFVNLRLSPGQAARRPRRAGAAAASRSNVEGKPWGGVYSKPSPRASVYVARGRGALPSTSVQGDG
jgi:hypothetical protein